MTAPANRRLGKIELGGFRLFEVIGEGAFGTAYLADQMGTDRKAVVKIAHAHIVRGPTGPAILRLFEAEVRAASRIHHPSLVTLYTAGTTADGLPAMATEYIAGQTLGEVLRVGLSRADIQSCFEQVGSGLGALHREGIVHRDLSPQNVMVAQTPHGLSAKIIDFGVAKLLDAASSGLHAVGTPRYIAPEQLRGEAETASDMYALGALLHFALARREYLGDIHNVTELLAAVSLEEPPPSLRTFNDDVTPAEDELVRELLSARPEDRPHAEDFLARWATLAPAARARRALVVHEDPQAITDLVSELHELGFEVETTSNPQRASRAMPEAFELVVVSSTLSSVDAVKLVNHLEEYLPKQEIWVVGTRFGASWQHLRRARCIALPGDLGRLAGMVAPAQPSVGSTLPPRPSPLPRRPLLSPVRGPLSSGAPSSSPPRSRRLSPLPPTVADAGEALIGGGAEILAVLADARDDRDYDGVGAASERLAQLAQEAGAWRLTELARALRAVSATHSSTSIDALLSETEAAYRTAVREFLSA